MLAGRQRQLEQRPREGPSSRRHPPLPSNIALLSTHACDLCIELYEAGATKPFLALVVEVQLTPLVIGPGDVPAITDPNVAKHSIELTFVSGVVHGHDPIAVRIGLALAHALDASPDHELAVYWDTFLASLGEPIRKELEMELQRRGWQPRSEWGKEIFANGVAEGMREGELLGIAKGELLGQVKGRAAAIIALLEVRGVSVSTALREQVMACTDLTLLDRWFRRAATAHSVEETFAP